MRKQDWMFWVVQQTLIFPLMLLPGLLLPLASGPGWMQLAAKFDPLTYLVDAERSLFAGDLASMTVLWASWPAGHRRAGPGRGIRGMSRSAD